MGVAFLPDRRPFLRGSSDAGQLWAAAVVANGGTVSAGRLAIVNTFIAAEQTAGTWWLSDDYWGLFAEGAPQALTSLKQRRLATVVAAPTFTIDRGYVFNGTTQYIRSGFIPSTSKLVMTGTNLRIAVYERANLAASTCRAGTTDNSTRLLTIFPRSAGGAFIGGMNATQTAFVASGIVDSRGYWSASRTPASVYEGYKAGVSAGTYTPGANATALALNEIFFGANNALGTANTFSACSLGLVCVGASMSAAQELAQYTNVQAWATAVGANV